MNPKQKAQAANKGRKEKMIPVAPESQQARAPGAAPPRRENEQSAAALFGNPGSRQGSGPRIGERGGPGAQQSGWSSRQQAERIKARGEESRLGQPQQSGYGGAEHSHPLKAKR